ncbi:MAG: TetR/AcrR family transcriptional regulator [Proteobacteria bacterium]|nr:TetR/AcrR family transcriptional regulator [Pseudomonadota bacterium]
MNQLVQKPDGRRNRHAGRRQELLEQAADYVAAHGLNDLSVRDLAAGVGLSHRTLLYHFGSKDQLLREVLDHIRARDGARIRAALAADPTTSAAELLRVAWGFFSSPARTDFVRLYHQVFALGLSGEPWAFWSRTVVAARTSAIAASLQVRGCPASRATAAATLVVASIRGLQLHLLTTNDRTGTDAAFEELVLVIEAQLGALSR